MSGLKKESLLHYDEQIVFISELSLNLPRELKSHGFAQQYNRKGCK